MIQYRPIIEALVLENVDFILIGGLAVILHGASYLTQDIDIAYSRDRENIARLVRALKPFNPKLRLADDDTEGIPFPFDERTIANGSNFTLLTDICKLDVLGHVSGFSNYREIRDASEIGILYEMEIRLLSLDGLIRAKKAANRPKDHLILPELEVLREAESKNE